MISLKGIRKTGDSGNPVNEKTTTSYGLAITISKSNCKRYSSMKRKNI